ncbi:hypothetical protein ONZ45_g7610 [Pleurotus djamor]|nr:hypothetical protein ONZ45_g7610 [Pleurotus djamor]
MADKLFTKFDNNKYLWHTTSDGSVVRPLAGGELVQDTLNRFVKGEQTLFIGAHLELQTPLSEARLTSAVRDAWIWLRYHIPTIATRIDPRDDGTSALVYKPGDIDGWCKRTCKVVHQPQLSLEALRLELGRAKVPSPEGDQTWVYLLVGPTAPSGSVSSFGILIHTHHAPFDGNGLKITMNRFLTQLARTLGSSDIPTPSLHWGNEVENLTPAVFNVLSPSVPRPISPVSSEEPSPDHPYYASVLSFMVSLGQTLENPYGFRPKRGDPGTPSPGYATVPFTIEESARLLSGLKRKQGHATGQGYTVSHLAHAALAMTTVADNPPTSEASTQYLNNLHLRDCRNLLVEPYSSRQGFPGYTLSVGVMRLPVSLFLSQEGNSVPLDKPTLVRVIRQVRDLYAAHAALQDPVNYMGLVSELFIGNIIAASKVNILPPSNGYSFSSDGVSEKFLDVNFKDASGQTVFKMPKFLLSLNHTQPAPFFRITSWEGAIHLSADFNSNLVSAHEVKTHLDNWKRFMLLGADFSEDDL